MDDIEAATPPHPSFGGKSIESVQQQQQEGRPPYKSWRKKYRKIRARFDGALEENRALFKQEHKLEGLAKRLREELDNILESLLEFNQNPIVPPELRFDVRLPQQRQQPSHVPAQITPRDADQIIMDYTNAVQQSRIPPLDLAIVREQVNEALAAQNVTWLEKLEVRTPHPIIRSPDDLPEECRGEEPPAFMTTDQEAEYYARLDALLDTQHGLAREHAPLLSPHQADLTPRELERQMELLNPQSQHNWLKNNTKVHDADDVESLASHESKPATRKRPGKNLAKQVGDRALERAREGISPSAASGFDEDELALPAHDDHTGSGKKRVRDSDGAFRVKGGKSAGSATKGKRKRATEEGLSTSVSKRMKTGEGDGE